MAIAIGMDGLPFRAFSVNRWVTDEWVHSAREIERLLPRFDLRGAGGDALVNEWLTAAIAFSCPQVVAALRARDQAIAA